MNKSPRVLLIGATDSTGREILTQAKIEGLSIRAMAENPASLQSSFLPASDIVRGDVLDRGSLVMAMAGIDTVISVLELPLTLKPVPLLSEGTRNVVEAMREAGIARLLCVTGMGAGDSRGHAGLVDDWVILPTLLRSIYESKNRREPVMTSGNLDWVVIRPARLVNSAPTGRYREVTHIGGKRMRTIARKDVAHFIVQETMRRRYSRQTVNLTY